MGVEALASSLECAVGEVSPQLGIFAEQANGFRQALGVIGFEVQRGVTPKFSQLRLRLRTAQCNACVPILKAYVCTDRSTHGLFLVADDTDRHRVTTFR